MPINCEEGTIPIVGVIDDVLLLPTVLLIIYRLLIPSKVIVGTPYLSGASEGGFICVTSSSVA